MHNIHPYFLVIWLSSWARLDLKMLAMLCVRWAKVSIQHMSTTTGERILSYVGAQLAILKFNRILTSWRIYPDLCNSWTMILQPWSYEAGQYAPASLMNYSILQHHDSEYENPGCIYIYICVCVYYISFMQCCTLSSVAATMFVSPCRFQVWVAMPHACRRHLGRVPGSRLLRQTGRRESRGAWGVLMHCVWFRMLSLV